MLLGKIPPPGKKAPDPKPNLNPNLTQTLALTLTERFFPGDFFSDNIRNATFNFLIGILNN